MKKNIPVILFIFVAVFIFISSPVLAQSDTFLDEDFEAEELRFEDEEDLEENNHSIQDPWENFNRKIFNFNDALYRRVFNPIAKGYNFVIPKPVQSSLYNVYQLSRTPRRVLNNLLQQKYKASMVETGRLLINSSVGIAGLFDPAEAFFNLEMQNEDFGQTLGHYGKGPGNYIMLPIIGPSNARDLVGRVIDLGMNPFLWFAIYDVEAEEAFLAFTVTSRINNYSYDLKEDYEAIVEDAIDPYVSLRHTFLEFREEQIED